MSQQDVRGNRMGEPEDPKSMEEAVAQTQREAVESLDRDAEDYLTLSQWQLVWRDFKKHKLAILGGVVLLLLYAVVIFAGFLAPHGPQQKFTDYQYLAPQRVRFVGPEGLQRPFIYGLKSARNPDTLEIEYVVDETVQYPIRFFVRGAPYRIAGIIPSRLKLFGVEEGPLFLLGTDRLGRDLLTRILYGTQISLTVGLVGVVISFVLGITFGGVSGFYGGVVDDIIQRIIEFLMSIPKLPLWMALAAALPIDWPVVKMYFAITLVLSIIGWTGLARVVRGKILALREEEFSQAAKAFGARNRWIIFRHLVPNFMSYLLVSATLSVPRMILGETSLSFLGLGLQPPAVSWGVLLKDAQQVQIVADYPWLLLPGLCVVITVLSFNFVGDGLRDAADPYKK